MSSNTDYARKRAREENNEGEEEKPPGEAKDGPEQPQQQHPSPQQPPQGGGAARAPPGPQGYYQPMYPPQGGEGGAYPPPRVYDNAQYPGGGYVPPGYPPPPYMGPYGMYPPYQHPMYGGPHHQQPPPPPPHGGPYYPDPNAPQARYEEQGGAGYAQGGGGGPIAPRASEDDRKPSARSEGSSHGGTENTGEEGEPGEGMEDEAGAIVPGAVTARLKTYIKPRIPSTQEVLDRRARKNAQSRARAAKLRSRIAEIEKKPAEDRTEEEQHVWQQYETRRRRKNDRSRERALEKKEEIDRILAKPDKKRTKIERQFLETALQAKKRKNEGDRLRRQRLKELGLSTKGSGIKPGVSARGPLPPQYQHAVPHQGYGMQYGHPGMGDIPMSPLPTMPGQHPYHHMQSPGGFGSPGMMPNMGVSPYGRRGPPHGTPGRPEHGHMPYMPPPHAYDQQQPSPSQRASRVEQRRNPDGSMSIQIGGGSGGQAGPSFGGEARMQGGEQQVNMSDVSNLFAEGESGYADQQGGGQEQPQDQEEPKDE